MSLPHENDERADSNSEPDSELDATNTFVIGMETGVSLNEFGETRITLKQDAAGDEREKPEKSFDVPRSFGKYEVREVLGRGGFGAVLLAYDSQLNRSVAIKVPLTKRSRDAAEEFLDEARRLAQLSHPGIVTVLDVALERKQCYIVSEYLDGPNLNQWMRGRTIHWSDTVSIIIQIADALAYAHSQSTVHRDLKPDNIILTERAEGLNPVIVDFGLAVSDEGDGLKHGVVAGTPNYMSPEQAMGEGHRVDGRTDIYALGVILYRMMCGQLPFSGADVPDLLQRVIREEPKPPRQLVRDIPAELQAVCLKALSKDIADRYTTAGDMAAELRAILSRHETRLQSPETETAVGEPPAQGPVRRQVTVLYCECDLFESATFFEKLDPEQQHELLREYQQMCREAVARLDGRIVQSTGESLLACFGYPTAYEDTAYRAVRVGLDLMDGIRKLQERIADHDGVEFVASIGVHTGLAVLQENADDESLSMIGDARSVATRLANAWEDNALVITDSTQRIVQGFFECESLGTFKIKGAPKKVEVFLVASESQARSRIDVAESVALTPLVGRDTELTLMIDLWEQAADGLGQIVCLIGEAGIGKSRLVREIREHVLAEYSKEQQATVEWRCSPFYKNTGFYPAIDYFERVLDFSHVSSPAKRLDQILQHLDRVGLGDSETISLLADLLSVPLDERFPPLRLNPVRQRERTHDALLRYVRQRAKDQPVLFMIEDLHWVDATTLEWLSQLVDQGPCDRLLTVLTFRPEFETPWGSRGHQTQVALNRLTRRQIEEMLQRRLKVEELPAGLVGKFIDRTEGVPLFVEEFCNVVRESGALKEVDGAFRLAEDFQFDAIPSTLQDLLLSRLGRLGSRFDVPQICAVIGREFSYEMIGAVSRLDEDMLNVELGNLVAAEVIFQQGTPPQAIYTFKHALIQDAAYESLLKKTRQRYHGQVADVLESQFPECVEYEPELLAHHFTNADQGEKAIGYWLKAGQRSQIRSANTEAISHLTRGLEILQTLDESPQRHQLELGLQTTLGPVLMAARGWAAAEVGIAIERARQLCAEIGTVADQFFVMWGLWGWRVIRADMDICDGIAEDIMRLVDASPEGRELLSEAYWVPGCTAYYKGDFRTALRNLEKGLELFDAERASANSLRTGQNCGVMYRNHIALALWELGFPDRALQQAEDMVRFARELEHPFSMAMALHFQRRLLQCCGRTDQARETVKQEYRLCHEQGFIFFEVHAVLARGDFLVRRGKIDAARKLFELGLQMLQRTGGKLSMDHPYGRIAEAYLLAGRLDDAKEWLDRGFVLVDDHNYRSMESEFLRLKGARALSSGDEVVAEKCFQQAGQVARRQQAKSRELRAVISLARLRKTQGRQEEGRQILWEVYDSFDEGFGTADLVEAKTLLDELGA